MPLNNPTPLTSTSEVPVPKWQHYKSSRPALKMITKEGTRVVFTKFTFMTQDQLVISYLDAEIALGLNVISKGELLTAEESDPMEALRRKHIEEYKAEEIAKRVAEAKGETRVLGNTEGGGAKLKTATTKHVAS